MIIDPTITEKDIDSLIRLAKTNGKSGLIYFIIVASIVVAAACTYPFSLDSGSFSISQFLMFDIIITLFLLFLVWFLWKSQLMPGLWSLGTVINQIANDDWSSSIYFFKNLPPIILKHPVTRCIIGLYVYKYGKETKGLEIINKAATGLPEINKAIENGRIYDVAEFKKLTDMISEDTYPTCFAKVLDFLSGVYFQFTVVYAILVVTLILYKVIQYFNKGSV